MGTVSDERTDGNGLRSAEDCASTRLYADVIRRIAAYSLDHIIYLLLVLVPVMIILQIFMKTGTWKPSAPPNEVFNTLGFGAKCAIMFAFFVSTGPVYFILCHASPWQATFGKRLLNIYVSSDDGSRISLVRSFGRWLAQWFFSIFLGNFISVVTISATQKGKGIHDFVAHTVVLRGRRVPGEALETWRIAAFVGLPILWITGTFLLTA